MKYFFILLLALLLSGCDAELYTDLSEYQANEMILVLSEADISASRTKNDNEKYSLSINRKEFGEALALLNSRGLPSSNFQSLGEVFKSDKIVSTPFEERARFMYALSQELSQSITHINGVVSSRVHITLPEETPFTNNKSVSKASVFIYYEPEVDITPYVPIIKNLVTKSVDGLYYENVTIALFNAQSSNQSNIVRNAQSKSKSFGLSPFFIFIIISFVVFFILSKIIWKPSKNSSNLETVANQNMKSL